MTKKVLKIILAVMVLLLSTTAYGCSEISELTQGTSSKSPNIVRGAELGEEWRMDQLIVNVEADEESLILLRLDYGDKVDGYFYV